jgi:hypothetical protein
MRLPREERFDGLAKSLEGLGDDQAPLATPVTRRKLLGGMLVATAGAVPVAGLLRPAMARSATTTSAQTITRNGNTITLGPILAPDGFPQASIQGSYVGTRGGYCMVNTGNSVLPVPVLPATRVLAGGARRDGALSALSVGDAVFVFTTIADSGERVAVKIEQNPRLYNLEVSTISGSQIVGATLSPDPAPGRTLQLTVNALTNFAQSIVPQVGNRIRVATISDAKGRESVAMNVVVMSA